MTKDIKNESLIKALSHFLLKDLPDVDTGENIWIKSLALVRKCDGSESYVYVVKDSETLQNRIAKDFGSVAQISEIIEFYPFSFLKSCYVPTFNGKKKEDRVKYLMTYDNRKDYSEMTLKELDREIIRVGIEKQLNDERNGR
jgi:hypothetical protein